MEKTLKLWLHNLLAVLQVSCSLGVSYLLSRFHLKLWPPTVTACFCPCSQTPLLHNCQESRGRRAEWFSRLRIACVNVASALTENWSKPKKRLRVLTSSFFQQWPSELFLNNLINIAMGWCCCSWYHVPWLAGQMWQSAGIFPWP